MSWFVNEMLTLEKIISDYFKTNMSLEITPQEELNFQQSDVCWLCEASFAKCTAPSICDASFTECENSREKTQQSCLRIPKALRVKFEIAIVLLDTTEEQPILNVT